MNIIQSVIILAVAVYILATIIAAKYTAKSRKIGILKIIWEKPCFWIVFWPVTVCVIVLFGILAAIVFSCLALSNE